MKKLSKRQSDILAFIKKYTAEKGYPPTVREIGNAVGLNSTASVHAQLKTLAAMKYIERNDNLTRAIRIKTSKSDDKNKKNKTPGFVNLSVIGGVAAGEPLFSENIWEQNYPVPESILAGGEGFMLTVKGNSMIDVGILDGDLVIVRSQNTAENGEIVVARIDDEITVKRFFKEDGKIKLSPENQEMEPLYYDSVDIEGIVLGLVRIMV